jgi:glycosyltransferase involved in cell wall biosynthesis
MQNSTQPLVTVILLTYNQENLVAMAVESLLAQTYSPLEIILSDDASTDNTFAVMQSLVDKYKGIHRIVLNQNQLNLGIAAHVNTALALSGGELIFAAAGDDISMPDRCEKVVSAWLTHDKRVDLIATDAFDMSFNGEILGVKETDNLGDWHSIAHWFIHPPYVFGASHAWTRDFINRFGALSSKIKQEDQVMIFRAILTGSAIRLAEPLVKHRRGGVSQKERGADVYEKRQEMIVGNLNSLEFIRQCIKDAKVLAQEDVVKTGFKDKLNYESMINSLFQSTSVFEAVKIAFVTKQVAVNKRIRFLTYASFPWLMMPFFLIKKTIKTIKTNKA